MSKSKRVFDDSINVPITKAFKQRIRQMADRFPGRPKPTAMARLLLEEVVDRREKQGASAK